ncbi:molybdopterin-dependent oxidoreductase [Rhodobacteraceae bacterium ASV31]|nr:molybdopterin-dependent oxidoreductase [Anianabacter salinae]
MPISEDDILLTVSGELDLPETSRSDSTSIVFDRAMLEALPEHSFTTTTIWTAGEQTFTGVALAELLAHFGIEGRLIKAVALNDYSVDIPFDEIGPDAPIIAYERNGGAMSVRDKGPLWVVYPYDLDDSYRTELVYQRSIWQLDRLRILP